MTSRSVNPPICSGILDVQSEDLQPRVCSSHPCGRVLIVGEMRLPKWPADNLLSAALMYERAEGDESQERPRKTDPNVTDASQVFVQHFS